MDFDNTKKNMPASEAEPFLTITELCAQCHLKPHAVRRAIKTEIIPAYTFMGSRWLVKKSEVLAVVQRLQIGGTNNE